MKGKIILLNGTSSAGKSTLCKLLKDHIGEPFWYMAADQLLELGIAPSRKDKGGDFDWNLLRPQFFEGFHRILPAFANAGNNLIIEHIIESEAWLDDLLKLLYGFDVFFVGVHCSLAELDRRERMRGDRQIGEAHYHLKTHSYCTYDFEVNTQNPPAKTVNHIIHAWQNREQPSVFEQMYQGKFTKA